MDIAISDLWRMVRQRLLLIMSVVLVAVLGTGLCSFYLLTPLYQATTTLLVNYQSPNHQLVYDDLMSSEKLLKTYNQIIQSRQVVDDVIHKLQLQTTATELMKRVQVKADNESLLTSISVTDASPEQAAKIANGFASTAMAKLNGLMDTQNVSILDAAQLDPHPIPVYPRPYFYMALSFVISLVVGVGVALWLDVLDKTLKTEEQVEELFGVPVLGIIPAVKKIEGKKAEKLRGKAKRKAKSKAKNSAAGARAMGGVGR